MRSRPRFRAVGSMLRNVAKSFARRSGTPRDLHEQFLMRRSRSAWLFGKGTPGIVQEARRLRLGVPQPQR